MDPLIETVLKQLGGNALQEIAQKVGVDEETAQKAISVAAPLLLAALARNSSTPAGAQALHQALTNDHDGSILEDIVGFLTNPEAANGAGILRHVLGDQQQAVQSGLAQTAGLDAGSMGQILEMAAPLIMGALGQTTQQQGLDADGLSKLLKGQTQAEKQQEPDLMGTIGQLLGTGDTANVVSQVGSILGKLFGGR